ncbi:hypothetical protein NDA11_001035 [Ustilago hordei]|uniref:GAG-pre-integrase domain-containing protein n=1 Tax=Ustilago hordei TaxID=120017 RepID=I2FMP9_USTHO|nr:hypothetical protein NDA11_001035 [Ustilago hordei]CCF48192.1 uncharacterized protein UHOR_13015 [Ustilago hordei]
MALALAFFTEVKLAPIDLPPQFVPFMFDSGTSCIMVNSLRLRKDWKGIKDSVGITTADGGKLSAMKMGRIAKGMVTFEDELITIQDKYGHMIRVPTSGNGYPAAAMIIWDNSMPEPSVSLAFAVTMADTAHSPKPCSKADLWHWRLGHASHESILHTHAVTHAHDILASPTTQSGVLCNVCV